MAIKGRRMSRSALAFLLFRLAMYAAIIVTAVVFSVMYRIACTGGLDEPPDRTPLPA